MSLSSVTGEAEPPPLPQRKSRPALAPLAIAKVRSQEAATETPPPDTPVMVLESPMVTSEVDGWFPWYIRPNGERVRLPSTDTIGSAGSLLGDDGGGTTTAEPTPVTEPTLAEVVSGTATTKKKKKKRVSFGEAEPTKAPVEKSQDQLDTAAYQLQRRQVKALRRREKRKARASTTAVASASNATSAKPMKPATAVAKTTTKVASVTTVKMLVVPKGAGTVTQKFSANNIRPHNCGVRYIHPFESGAALVTVAKAKEELFRSALAGAGLTVAPSAGRNFVFRVHRIPSTNSLEDVTGDIVAGLGKPIKVELAAYRGDNRDMKSYRMAVVTCGRALFERAERRRAVLIGCARCPVSTTPRPMSCRECGMLGHTHNHCSDARRDFCRRAAKDRCLDCQWLAVTSKERGSVDAGHRTGSALCPVKTALIRRVRGAVRGG